MFFSNIFGRDFRFRLYGTEHEDDMDRNLMIFGLAKKAGLLAVGADDVNAAARTGKAHVIISARDSSGSAVRRAQSSAETGRIPHIVVPFTSFELGSVSGRGSPGTVAFLDAGLAASLLTRLAEMEPERYRESAELLADRARAQTEKKRRAQSGKRGTMQ